MNAAAERFHNRAKCYLDSDDMIEIPTALFCDMKFLSEQMNDRVAADDQQYDRIASLERERDEARAAYLALRDLALADWLDEDVDYSERYIDRPEWRKEGRDA